MDRDEALKLLRGGARGVREWNRRRGKAETIPDLRGAKLDRADLKLVNLSGAKLSCVHLDAADLSNADLSDADFGHANLLGADLTHTNLSRANLTTAKLAWSNLRNANLQSADLSRALLRGADLTRANLISANLVGADLCGAHLCRSNLRDANLSRAVIYLTVFSGVDLSHAKSLEDVNHRGPSYLGIESIIKSGGQIPLPFVEGCGIPDNWITYLPSLLGKSIDFYSCFISYSHQDEEFSKRLHSRMREDKLRVWYAPEDMKSGRKIHEQIDSAIKLHDKLLVVLSEHSMQSEWVKTEIRNARQREFKEGKRVLFPIRLVPFETICDWKAFDSDTGKDMAVEIREYFIPDFTDWKDHDSFEEAYQRLMQDFKPSPDDG